MRKIIKIIVGFSIVLSLAGLSLSVFAAPAAQGEKLSEIYSITANTVGNGAMILSNIALIASMFFIFAGIFKIYGHKQNPTQVPLSQGIVLFVVGILCSVFPLVVPTAKNAVFGSKNQVSRLSATNMQSLIGTP